MPILATFKPTPEERGLIERRLPVRWLCDGADPGGCEGMLSLWPRKELRGAALTWHDLPDAQWLKVITAGVNHIGWPEIPEHVVVMSTPDATSEAIAEYCLGAVIAWARGFQQSTADIHAGRFRVGQPTRAVADLKIGIVGHGGLGKAIARTMLRQGAEVRAVSRSGTAGLDMPVSTMTGLPEMAAWADVLVLALPLVRDTFGLIDADVLQTFDQGLLLNVARGEVVDEVALRDWLVQDPDHRWAHLDVWWQYPKEGRPYTLDLALPNLTATPHNSPNTKGFRLRMLERACEDLDALLVRGEQRHIQHRQDHALPRDGDGR